MQDASEHGESLMRMEPDREDWSPMTITRRGSPSLPSRGRSASVRVQSFSGLTGSTSGRVVFWSRAATSPALRKARRTLPPRILWMSASE